MNNYAQRFKTTEARFWEKVDKSAECWLWQAGSVVKGYGRIRINGRMQLAHRVAWELTYGKIPNGMCVLHACDVRACTRPDHLFLGTYADNTRDAIDKGRNVMAGALGTRNPATNLCELDVWLIRNIKGQTHRAIAKFFDISRETVTNIINRKTWRHV